MNECGEPMYRCTACGEWKVFEDFQAIATKCGRSSSCKPCVREYNRRRMERQRREEPQIDRDARELRWMLRLALIKSGRIADARRLAVA